MRAKFIMENIFCWQLSLYRSNFTNLHTKTKHIWFSTFFLAESIYFYYLYSLFLCHNTVKTTPSNLQLSIFFFLDSLHQRPDDRIHLFRQTTKSRQTARNTALYPNIHQIKTFNNIFLRYPFKTVSQFTLRLRRPFTISFVN